ncbi:SF-assemblin, putative [Plasmodium vinckei brucechwatti]|uniref:SF-assemblin, putative n=1 Tax=Plasmodium vinckei brucechwatti TaxID=119398 RepID=A0A6V7SHZ0_PLAVN|nr:SF-assemblin, putative [Plasmodium vinckei brucechwatti]
MFDKKEDLINSKNNDEFFKKTYDNLSKYSRKGSENSFDKRDNNSISCSYEKNNIEETTVDNFLGINNHNNINSHKNYSNFSKFRNNSSANNIYYENLFKKRNKKNKLKKTYIRNISDDIKSNRSSDISNTIESNIGSTTDSNIGSTISNIGSKRSLSRNIFIDTSEENCIDINKNNSKEENKDLYNNTYKIDSHIEENKKEKKDRKTHEFSEIPSKNLYENNFNHSSNLRKNDISYYCENNKISKNILDKNNNTNLKLNMSSINRVNSMNSVKCMTRVSSINNVCNMKNIKNSHSEVIYDDDNIFYKTNKMSSERTKVGKKNNLGCSLKKRNNMNYDNDNVMFSEIPRKSFDINEKCINNNTKIKIKRLCEKIEGFEKEIKNEIMQKKSVEKEKIYVIREAINKLEKNLNSEIKKRIEHNKNIQTIFSSEISKVQEKIENVVNDKVNEIQNAIKVLNDKINTISGNIENEKIKCIQNLEKKNNNIAKEFSNLQASFQQDKINNKEKENNICKKLEEIEKKSESKIANEKKIRDSKYQEIISYIEEIKRENKGKNENFQNFVLEEISTIKNGLVMESQAREAADDDIVQAVNHYTKALQDSLRLINSN